MQSQLRHGGRRSRQRPGINVINIRETDLGQIRDVFLQTNMFLFLKENG